MFKKRRDLSRAWGALRKRTRSHHAGPVSRKWSHVKGGHRYIYPLSDIYDLENVVRVCGKRASGSCRRKGGERTRAREGERERRLTAYFFAAARGGPLFRGERVGVFVVVERRARRVFVGREEVETRFHLWRERPLPLSKSLLQKSQKIVSGTYPVMTDGWSCEEPLRK